MAPHSSTLAWKIPWTEEPGRLQVHGAAKSRTRLSDFTFTFHFHALEKEMATHSSVVAWRIPGTGELGGLPSMGSHRVGHEWSDLAAAAARSRVTAPLPAEPLISTLREITWCSSYLNMDVVRFLGRLDCSYLWRIPRWPMPLSVTLAPGPNSSLRVQTQMENQRRCRPPGSSCTLNQEEKISKSVDGEETCKILSPVLSGRNDGCCQSKHTYTG